MPPKDAKPRRARTMRLVLLFLVPIMALIGWHAIREPDRMCPPPAAYYLPSLLYDEYDLSAMSLRGLNAELGRHAGLQANPRGTPYEYFSKSIEVPRPLKDRYFLEYPHAMLLLFRAGYWIQPGWSELPMPPGIPDCGYHNIAAHDPETDDQFAFWKVFVVSTQFYVGIMFAAWVLLILVLEWGYGESTSLRGGSLLLILPAAIFFTLNRFDVLPALVTALAFASLGRRKIALAAFLLGLATLLKVYPILFAPLILRYLWPQRTAALRFAAMYTATGLLALHPLLLGEDFEGVIAPYKFQLLRSAEHGLTIYGCLLPVDLADGVIGGLFRLGALGTTISLLLVAPIRDLAGLLRRCAIVLMVFVSLAVFYSPQWILWFVPLVGPLCARQPRLGWWAGMLDVVNYLTFPVWFWILPELYKSVMPLDIAAPLHTQTGNLLRLARFLCCGLIVVNLVRMEYPVQMWLNWLRGRMPSREAVFARRT